MEAADIKDTKRKMTEMDFMDPTSAESRLVLWIYTIEPSFYQELNTTSREELWKADPNRIHTLGPFALALFGAMLGQQKREAPPITFPGLPVVTHPKYKHLTNDYSRAYNLFRGSKLKEEWLSKWNAAVGSASRFSIPGLLSTSRDPGVGISFIGSISEQDSKDGFEAYLWVFTCVSSLSLFSLDSSEYSAFPHEREVLLEEGRPVWVLAKEKVFTSRMAQ